MITRAFNFIYGLLPHHLSREVKELYWSTMLLNIGMALVQIFEPIYLFSLGYSLSKIALFYLSVYLLYFIIMPLGAKFACYYGTEKSIVISSVFTVLLYLSLYGIQLAPGLFYAAVILYALQKTFYWPAFHADFAQHIIKTETGREVSGLKVSLELLYVIGPVVGGALIALGGFGALFIAASFIFLISNLPLLTTKEVFVRHDFSYGESYKKLFSRENSRRLLAYSGYAEEVVLTFIWPVFMVIIIKDNFEVGLVASISMGLSLLVTLASGRLMDKQNQRAVLRFSSIIYSLAWALKAFVRTVGGVFLINSLTWISKNMIDVGITTMTYNRAHSGRVMSSVVAFESSLVLGKIGMLVLLYIIFANLPDLLSAFNFSFLAAGLTSLLYMLL